jgi:hypothetical protein
MRTPTDSSAKPNWDAILPRIVVYGFVTAGLYVACTAYIDAFVLPSLLPPDGSMLSYGQLWGMISLPTSGWLGASIGATIHLPLRFAWLVGWAVPAFTLYMFYVQRLLEHQPALVR